MSLEILRISEPRLLSGHSIPLRRIELAYRGQRVEPIELSEEKFRQLGVAGLRVEMVPYAEGLLEMFGPWSPEKSNSRGRR